MPDRSRPEAFSRTVRPTCWPRELEDLKTYGAKMPANVLRDESNGPAAGARNRAIDGAVTRSCDLSFWRKPRSRDA